MKMLLRLLVVTCSAFLLGTWGAWVLAGTAEEPGPGATAAVDHDETSRQYFTDLELVNQDGETVRFYSDVLKDKVVIISFIFTHCEGACPMLTRKLTLARDMLEDKLANPIWFVSISIDPERDTVEAMKKFATQHEADHEGWVFLTGDPQNVNQIIRKLGQYTEDIDAHSTLMLAGNVKTRHWMKIPPQTPPTGIAEKLRLLVEDYEKKS